MDHGKPLKLIAKNLSPPHFISLIFGIVTKYKDTVLIMELFWKVYISQKNIHKPFQYKISKHRPLGITAITEWFKGLSWAGELVDQGACCASLMIWVQSLEPTAEDRTNNWQLSSGLHMHGAGVVHTMKK